MEISNPFSDPAFRDRLLRKENIKDNTRYEIADPDDDLDMIISKAPMIPSEGEVSNIIHDASALSKYDKNRRSQEMSLALNDLFTKYNEQYDLKVNVNFDDISKSIALLSNDSSRRALELYVSNTFNSFKSLITLKLLSSMAMMVDHMLSPERLFSEDFQPADCYLIVEKLLSYIQTLESLKDSINIQGADLELQKLGQEKENNSGDIQSGLSDDAKEFLRLMKKRGINGDE